MKKCVFHIGFLVILMLCSSCVSRGVREAQEVVAQADSLWHDGQMYGIDAGDSATLAQAYETLDKSTAFCRRIREIFPFAHRTSSLGTYSHACYHYGRLLREKDDPVAAMQAFINATHSHTDDYHILGRVYSNMGSICHLAGEFPLSYDMYERCADMYLQNGDTLLYYYGLNEMAFELAEMGESKKLSEFFSNINDCPYPLVKSDAIKVKAIFFRSRHQYDSVLHYINNDITNRNLGSFDFILKAQAFFYMQMFDSASIYAQKTLDNFPSLSEQDNAYYILLHCDSIFHKNNIYAISADRADVEKDIEIQHGKMSQAVQLLEQDLTSKPNLAWLYAIGITIIIIGLIIWLYVWRKRRQHALLSQQVEELTIKNKEAQDMQTKRYNDRLRQIQENCDVLTNSDNIVDSLQWKNYDKFCECVNVNFFLLADKLKATSSLNEKEIRFCVLVLIGSYTDKQMADILYYSYNSIRSTKRILAKKLGTTSANLRSFLIEKAAK